MKLYLVVWRKTTNFAPLSRIAVKEELLDMLRCNDKQFKIKRNGFN